MQRIDQIDNSKLNPLPNHSRAQTRSQSASGTIKKPPLGRPPVTPKSQSGKNKKEK